MLKTFDVRHINPFLKSAITVIQMITQIEMAVGKPAHSALMFNNATVIIGVGVTGELQGQVLIELKEEDAKKVVSAMMGGRLVEVMDEMACSAISELGNMIMGNAATMFANAGISSDITTPLLMQSEKIKLHAGIEALRVPLMHAGAEFLNLYICVAGK